MRTKVFFEKVESYDDCTDAVCRLLDKCCHESYNFDNVLIKPNHMMPKASVEQCVNTDPAITSAVQLWVATKQNTGARMETSDNFSNFYKFYDSDLGCYEVASKAIDASLVINVSKLKSHYLMKITAAIKNMFGCVNDRMKWHFKLEIDKFAELIYKACYQIRPQIVLVDAIDVLEGYGPGPRGRKKHLGYLIAGTDPYDVDRALLNALNVRRRESPIHKYGETCKDLEFQPLLPLFITEMYLPSGEGRFWLETNNDICTYCNECVERCPADAIIEGRPGTPPMMTNKCIKCCVCLEFCPTGAIYIKKKE